MSTRMLWVLGAADPEMAAIKTLLAECGEQVAQACVGLDDVQPGNAYRATGFRLADGEMATLWDGPVVRVECDRGDRPWSQEVTVVDHHRPGDPGYGRPPEDFLAASSVGQVLAILGQQRCTVCGGAKDTTGHGLLFNLTVEDAGQPGGLTGCGDTHAWSPPRFDWRCAEYEQRTQWLFVAAADHSLEAAYRGRCPGVEPEALMRWRVETRAAFQKRFAAAVLADIEAARKVLRAAAVFAPYADLRGSQFFPELPEAAAREGIPFLATVKEKDGREKVVLQAAPPELVAQFLAGKVVPGLTELYGDPARGFAGGYVNQFQPARKG